MGEGVSKIAKITVTIEGEKRENLETLLSQPLLPHLEPIDTIFTIHKVQSLETTYVPRENNETIITMQQ